VSCAFCLLVEGLYPPRAAVGTIFEKATRATGQAARRALVPQTRLVIDSHPPILQCFNILVSSLPGPTIRQAIGTRLVETTTAPAAPPVDETPSFLVRHQFIIYRLFSLSGLIPVGAYLVVHLATNATILNGTASFQDSVDRIHSLGVALLPIEIIFIFLPILFHAAVGWLIISGALPNTSAYPYASNIRYTMQRVTGIIAFVFILFHVIQLHHLAGEPFKEIGGAQFDAEHAASTAAVAMRPLWITILYAIGMLSTVYHFANGLWTQGITWGLWTSAAAQRRASWISGIVGVLLAAAGLGALGGFNRVDVEQAKKVEDKMLEQRAAILDLEKPAATPEAPAE
jgi:succinate dehydrogenase / fumarate reductase cytochrome b subunit